MNKPVIAIADKVVRMMESMVYLAVSGSYRSGATVEDLSGLLSEWVPAGANIYHHGAVERALCRLQHEGRVKRAGSRWYARPAFDA